MHLVFDNLVLASVTNSMVPNRQNQLKQLELLNTFKTTFLSETEKKLATCSSWNEHKKKSFFGSRSLISYDQ